MPINMMKCSKETAVLFFIAFTIGLSLLGLNDVMTKIKTHLKRRRMEKNKPTSVNR